MMQGQIGSISCARRRILQATIQLYREIGYSKTNVLDIAGRASMSPANVYRFFRSKQEIEETVAAELLDELYNSAASAARTGGLAVDRLQAILRTISQLHERRLASDKKLHEFIATAMTANWPIVAIYTDRIAGLLEVIIASGQARGEIRAGSAAILVSCLLRAMNAHLSACKVEGDGPAVRPVFDDMMAFCLKALCSPVPN